MIYVGIDVAKDKHDCFITNSDGEVLFKAFTIANNLTGFTELYQKIESVAEYLAKKRAEGKHYNVAISHAIKKLVRVIYHLEKTNQQYIKAD